MGGPHEIFEAVLPPDPLLYAEPADPQSLNKYNYCLGNPLRYIDPDGHQTTQTDALIIVTPKTAMVAGDVAVGVGKEVGNIGIGMSNVSADFGIGRHTEPYRASNMAQGMAMVVTRDISILGAFLTGKPQAGVMMEEAEAPAVVAGEAANATRTASEGSGAAQTPKEGVYEFPDNANPGKTYVGQSGNMPRRLGEHSAGGRLTPGNASTTSVGGGRVAREVAEQGRINQLGGTRNNPGSRTSNIRNPVSRQRQRRLDEQ